MDFDITLTASEKVVFGDTKEGAFAIRLADALTEKSGSGKMMSSEGSKAWPHLGQTFELGGLFRRHRWREIGCGYF